MQHCNAVPLAYVCAAMQERVAADPYARLINGIEYSGIVTPLSCGSMATSLSSPSSSSSRQAEQHRIEEVRSSYRVLHRWTDKSLGAGFDVLVFPKCVIALNPTDPAASKTVVFPTSHDTKFRVFYKKNADCCESIACNESAEIRSEAPSSATASSPLSQKFVSELRICVRDSSVGVANEDLFRTTSPADIVLRWIDAKDQ